MNFRAPSLRYLALFAAGTMVPAWAIACSDENTSGPAPASAATADAAASADGAATPPPGSAGCSEIASACHPYDLGAGKTHECHELAEDPEKAATCAAESAACLAACSAGAPPLAVAIGFGAVVGDAPFACGTKYPALGAESSESEPLDLRFYVTDVKLIDEAGNDVPVTLTPDGAWQSADVALLDFEDRTGGCDNGTTETNDTVRGTVPFGKYKGVAFTIGVPESLNHTDVATAPTPLNLSGLNWGWQMGRIFFASGMRAAADDAGATNDSFFHVGSTGCTGEPEDGGTATCTNSNRPTFRFTTFRPSANKVVVDLKELLKDQKLASVMHGCHSFTEEACADGFGHLGLSFATGATTGTQTAFSVK